ETWVESRGQSQEQQTQPGLGPETRSEPAAEPERREPVALEPGLAKLYLNLGRRDRLRPPEVQSLIAERTGMSDLRIQVRNTHTYIIAPEERVEQIVSALHGSKHGERDLVCEPAKKPT